MKVLVIGGSGKISTAVCKEIIEREDQLFVLNRGNNNNKLPQEAHSIICDMNDLDTVKKALENHHFDSVIQFISYTVDDVKRDIKAFEGLTNQYIFISSASAYLKPIPSLPVTEEIRLDNKYWEYSRQKKECEEYLLKEAPKGFNVTIIRPSHTYDESMVISQLNSKKYPYTLLDRITKNKQVIIPDKGMSLWTLTYNKDFAKGFCDVIGNKKTYGEYYHLTSEKVYTWERIYEMICESFGMKPNIIHIPTDFILKYFPEYKGEIYGDKLNSLFFDNSKIKKVAKNYTSETDYYEILPEIIDHYTVSEDLMTIDDDFNKRYETCITDYVSYKKQTKKLKENVII